ncbi:hypothetical protein BC834DRAFT_523133 [Gloeopeniophorella convolvens]|nr:hypothetical protein BC834DRAFT_523133 [Gloeopeniophorella convolvens]
MEPWQWDGPSSRSFDSGDRVLRRPSLTSTAGSGGQGVSIISNLGVALRDWTRRVTLGFWYTGEYAQGLRLLLLQRPPSPPRPQHPNTQLELPGLRNLTEEQVSLITLLYGHSCSHQPHSIPMPLSRYVTGRLSVLYRGCGPSPSAEAKT